MAKKEKGERKRRTPRKPAHKLSRQRRWQIKMKQAGRCILCGKPRNKYAQHCDDCWRDVAGGKPWTPGKKGRPPKSSGVTDGIVILR